jgi:iron complex transport system substrate-binding protein
MSFETVYRYGKDANYWINVSLCKSLYDIIEQDNRYARFTAFKNGNIYNNTLHCNPNGYSNYWEEGFVFPNKILFDLIAIFHPQHKDSLHQKLNYYQKLH